MAIQQAQASSKYYLLFGKQTDGNGMYTKFWVDLKLPTNVFSCLTPSGQKLLSEKIRLDTEFEFDMVDRFPNYYTQAETKGLLVLKNSMEQIINRNCSVMTPDEIVTLFREKQFVAIPVEIQPPSIAIPIIEQLRSNNYIIDFYNLEISSNGISYNISDNFNIQYFDFLGQQGKSVKIYITKNVNFCDSLSSVYLDVSTDFSAISNIFTGWYHIWENPDPSKSDTLYSKLKISTQQFLSIQGTFQPNGLNYEGCTAQQDSILKNDVQFALKMLDTAYAKLNRYNGITPFEVKDALYFNFGGASDPITANYIKQSIMTLRVKGPWAGYDCVQLGDGSCLGNALAYAYGCLPLFDVRICVPNYFNHEQTNRSTTLIHEWSHKYECTGDLGYEWEPEYPTNSMFEQIWNADSYAELVKYLNILW